MTESQKAHLLELMVQYGYAAAQLAAANVATAPAESVLMHEIRELLDARYRAFQAYLDTL
jgi:hypothetical protein